MVNTPLDLQALLILSERPIRLVFPPELSATPDAFYTDIQEMISLYQLPVTCEPCQVRIRETLPLRNWRLVGLIEDKYKLLKVLVGIEQIGNIGYVERKEVLLTPNLPPLLDHKSTELPPRLSTDSPELPRPDRYATSLLVPSVFKSEIHKARVVKIEERRWERFQKIEARRKERAQLLGAWLDDALWFITHGSDEPLVRYLTDSVDLILGQIIKRYEEKGAEAKAKEESRRQQQELEEQAKQVQSKFM